MEEWIAMEYSETEIPGLKHDQRQEHKRKKIWIKSHHGF